VPSNLVAALDFWIVFTTRVARFPSAWVVLHRMLSAPLLLRLQQRSLAVDGVRVTCRSRSDQLAWLLDGASLVEDVTSSGPPDVEVVRIHPWAACNAPSRTSAAAPSRTGRTTAHKGIPVTSPSRTLIDCAEFMTADELRAAFARADELDLLDPEALRAARARIEWRPSLAMLDEVIAEFCD